MKDPYRRIAGFYDSITEPSNAVIRKIGLRLYPPTSGMKVLDIGCGTGNNLLLYEKHGCRVTGVDLSPSMLEVARSKLSDQAQLHLCDASDTPFADSSFDLITATLTLHEMPPAVRTAVLSEMIRVSKPDGRLLLVDFHGGPIRFPKGWFFKFLIVCLEIAAGREHFRNYRDFLARGCLPGLMNTQRLSEESTKVLSAGNMLAYLARVSDSR